MNHRITLLAAFTLVAGAALVAACSSSSTTTNTNTQKDAGGSGDTDGGSSGDTDSGSTSDKDAGNGGTDSGSSGTSDAGPGESCPGPAGGPGGCAAGFECENFAGKGGNLCTKACSDPGNATSADCPTTITVFTGKCTPNSYCQLK